jgi:hypothetical protein
MIRAFAILVIVFAAMVGATMVCCALAEAVRLPLEWFFIVWIGLMVGALVGVLIGVRVSLLCQGRTKAITQVLEQDRVFHRAAGSARYPVSMATIDLEGCPPKFRLAYQKHISAWKRNDANSIEDTWEQVKRLAGKYRVDVEPFE